jgi:hypothetical protein
MLGISFVCRLSSSAREATHECADAGAGAKVSTPARRFGLASFSEDGPQLSHDAITARSTETVTIMGIRFGATRDTTKGREKDIPVRLLLIEMGWYK